MPRGRKQMTRIKLEPEAQAFVEAAARLPLLFTLGPHQGRIALDEAQAGPVSTLTIDSEVITIDDGPGGQVALHILRPRHMQAPLPVIVYFHGTEWVFGSLRTH